MTQTARPEKDSDLRPQAAQRLRQLVPDGPIQLPAGCLACSDCGIAVEAAGLEPVVFEAVGRVGHPTLPLVDGPPARHYRTEMVQCASCAAREAHADAIVAAHPRISAKLGPAGAQQYVRHVLNGLAVLGRDVPDELSEVQLASLTRRLVEPGSTVAFARLFVPVQSLPADRCSPHPWSHVPPSVRLALRTGYGAVLADRMALSRPAQQIPPPEPAGSVPGCVYCGRGSLTRTAQEVRALDGMVNAQRELWRPISVAPQTLGGIAGQPVTGYVCEELCGASIDSVGSVGLSSLERAFSRWLHSVGRDADAQRVERGDVAMVGFGPWAANARQRGHAIHPTDEPFGHVRLG